MDKAMTGKARKVAAIAFLSQNYGEAMSDGLLDIWLGLLEDYTPEQVQYGVNEVIKAYEYKTRPPFAVLRKAIDNVSGIRRIKPEDKIAIEAEAEWNCLLENISAYGYYRKPDLHPTTEYVLRGMGGWEAACGWNTDKLEWRHKEFVEKWAMAYGIEGKMALGATGLLNIAEGPQSISEILETEKKSLSKMQQLCECNK